MTFSEALVLARDEGHWIRSVEEGQHFPHRWIKSTVHGKVLSFVFTDRSPQEQQSCIQPLMGSIDRYLSAWESQEPPQNPRKR